MTNRNRDSDLEKVWDRRAKDEEDLKRRLPPPQNAKEQAAMRAARDVDMEDDN
jgi:hypothetical protein